MPLPILEFLLFENFDDKLFKSYISSSLSSSSSEPDYSSSLDSFSSSLSSSSDDSSFFFFDFSAPFFGFSGSSFLITGLEVVLGIETVEGAAFDITEDEGVEAIFVAEVEGTRVEVVI